MKRITLSMLSALFISSCATWLCPLAQADDVAIIKAKPTLQRSVPKQEASEASQEPAQFPTGAGRLIPKAIIVEEIKKEGKVTFESSVINFDYGSDKIRKESMDQLNEMASALNDQGLKHIKLFYVDGHTCDQGSDSFNCDLSWRRSNSVIKVLVDVAGVDSSRLKARGFGEKSPAHPNDGETNREKNRRVVLQAANKDHNSGAPRPCRQ
jgi:outer membrane protein OmpA-like peptidoglycan-associated protein